MNVANPTERLEREIQAAPKFILGCLLPLLISLWFSPFSLVYIAGSVFIGILGGLFIIRYWKSNSLWWIALQLALGVKGEELLRYLAFPGMLRGQWVRGPLLLQYFSIIGIVIFALLWAFRLRIKQYLCACSAEKGP